MQRTDVPLRDVNQTVGEMFRIIGDSGDDVARYAGMGPLDFYEIVRKIPYRADPKGNEFLQRPSVTLGSQSPYGDCDDKAIAIAAQARAAGYPYRIVIGGSKAVRRKTPFGSAVTFPFHHVFPEVLMGGKWVTLDATYPHYTPGIRTQNYGRTRVYYPPAQYA